MQIKRQNAKQINLVLEKLCRVGIEKMLKGKMKYRAEAKKHRP